MLITGSVLQNLSSERTFIAGREVKESLDLQVDGQRLQIQRHEKVEVRAQSKTQLTLAADLPKVSQADLKAARDKIEPASAPLGSVGEGLPQYDLTPDEEALHKIRMLLAVLGHQVDEIDKQISHLKALGSLTPPQNGFSPIPPSTESSGEAEDFLRYSYDVTEWRGESLNVAASGVIKTADGREIAYGMSLEMLSVQYSHQQVNMSVGGMKDPLVLNLKGGPVALDASKRMQFDLDADGRRENVASLAAGSAYLALDRNGNGKIDDGRELFGALSGDGFADLAQYDQDGNGFIDEGDAVFEQLKLWRGEGQLVGLKEAGVGAIGLARLAGQFDLISQQQLAGQVRSTGLFFFESGQVGSVQQIDLAI